MFNTSNFLTKFFKLSKVISFCFIICLAITSPNFASGSQEKVEEEKILSFHSDIVINQDSTMQVTETIKVQSTGEQIKQGIFRDFPTKYNDRFGNRIVVEFDVVEVLRDGVAEKYRVDNISNGKRVYIGQEGVILSPGIYTYIIKYKTNRQLGFFEEHDELFWNVTGNGWAFTIENASSIVRLPGDVSVNDVMQMGYTGLQGSEGKDFKAYFDEAGNACFTTTRKLNPKEGLTIVVSFPKGIVTEPTVSEKIGYFVKDNIFVIIIITLFLLLILYYIVVWFKVGKDPAKGTIIPLYYPPEGFSPAALRYIRKMGFDDRTLACSIINMAVKGHLIIKEEKEFFSKYFSLVKTGDGKEHLNSEETKIYKCLFGSGNDSIKLKNTNHTVFAAAKSRATKSLGNEFIGKYFTTNLKYLNIGWLFSLLAFGFIAVIGYTGSSVLAGVCVLISSIIVNIIFTSLLKAPTLEGRELLDKVEGFKMYLSIAEKDELNYSAPVEKTPELFEKYLPYALALDVEQNWCEKFSGVLARAAEQNQNYSPHWYSGDSWKRLDTSRFASSIGDSFSSAISASSSPPGSHSGRGGGSSGGGGGGGGGGGW